MKTAAFKKYLIVIFLLIMFILSGCARMASVPATKPLYSLRRETTKVEGVSYVPAIFLCEVYGIDWQWDTVSYQLILEKDNHIVIMRPETKIILLDRETLYSKQPPIIHKGIFLIPFDLVKERLDKIFYIPYKVPERKIVHRIKTIVIDPGHGGKDPGAIGRSGLYEKNVVLDISKRLKRNLEGYGIKVMLTRETDKFIPLWQRANIANRNKADFFISIHANSFRSRLPSGFEVYYLSEACDDSARAVQAAENAVLDLEIDSPVRPSNQLKATLWDMINTENRVESIELAQLLCQSMKADINSKDRGVKSALFYVLKRVRAPAVLVEVGFISNRDEETKLRSASHRQRIADALAEGILRYKKRYELTDGFTN